MNSSMNKQTLMLSLVVLGLVVAVGYFFLPPMKPVVPHKPTDIAKKEPAERKPRMPHDRSVSDQPAGPQQPYDWGTAPQIKPDANPQVASVAEALNSKTHPERLTPNILPAPFDEKAYWANPQAYLNVVEPGRIWQVAQPGKDVKRIIQASPGFQFAEQHTPVTLKVQVLPGAPVTFTSFDMGQFENLLTSMTVKADDKGMARVQFTATGGTYGTTRIIAGSPLTADHAHFAMEVLPKGQLETFLRSRAGLSAGTAGNKPEVSKSSDQQSAKSPVADPQVSGISQNKAGS